MSPPRGAGQEERHRTSQSHLLSSPGRGKASLLPSREARPAGRNPGNANLLIARWKEAQQEISASPVSETSRLGGVGMSLVTYFYCVV